MNSANADYASGMLGHHGFAARQMVAVVLGGLTLAILAAYLLARNYSAHEAQPQVAMVTYRVIVSVVLMLPGVVVWGWAILSRQWRDVWLRLGLLVPWFVAALMASFMLGI